MEVTVGTTRHSNINSRAVLVMATLIPAAKQRVERLGDSPGKAKQRALPKAAPAVKNGKMKPPRYPPATVNDMATSLHTPTTRQFCHVSISKPIRPEVGQAWGSSEAGDIVASTGNSNSPLEGVDKDILSEMVGLINKYKTITLHKQ